MAPNYANVVNRFYNTSPTIPPIPAPPALSSPPFLGLFNKASVVARNLTSALLPAPISISYEAYLTSLLVGPYTAEKGSFQTDVNSQNVYNTNSLVVSDGYEYLQSDFLQGVEVRRTQHKPHLGDRERKK